MRRILSILLFFVTLGSYAQQFRFENYSVNAGLPQSQVYCQVQDDNGFLWLGTMGGGLAKFDGRNFTTYSTKDGLPNNFVHCLFSYQDTLWAGTQKGLCYFNGYSFIVFEDSVLKDEHIVSFYKDSSRTLIGTAQGIYESKKGSFFQNVTPLFGIERSFIATIFKDKHKTYWIGGSQGVFRYNPGSVDDKYKRFTRVNGLATNDIECFTELPDGRILAGTYGAGIYQIKDDNLSVFRVNVNLGNQIIHDFLLDDKLWVGTQRSGLYVIDLTTLEVDQITQKDGLANNHVRTITKDDWGTYWIGTSGGGVSKYFGQSFVHYTTKKGLPGNYIYSLHQDSKNQMWMGVSDKGIVRKDSIGFTVFGKDSGFINSKIKAIEEDKWGNLWLGTSGRGLYVYDGKQFKALPRQNGLKGRFVKDLLFDGEFMWSATIDQGIFRIQPELGLAKKKSKLSTDQFSLTQGVQSNRINALAKYKGNVWYGCQSNGVGYVQKSKVVNLLEFGFPPWAVRAMKRDEKGNLWVATGGNGLIRIYQDKEALSGYGYSVYGHSNGLLSTNIYSIYIADNTIYCGSENGIDELTLNDEYDVIETEHYGYDEGFVGVETCQNAISQDADGNLWFGTINGLSQYKPSEQVDNTLTPKVSFVDIRANLSPMGWISNVTQHGLKHFQNTISLEYVAVDLKHPKRVEYSYMLEGADEEWSRASSGNSVRFANLPSGEYKFRLKATSDGINWSDEKVFQFRIATAFWKTWWFWLLIILGFAVLVYAVFRYRIKTLQRQADEENQKYQMKNELLKLEQKALRLQMNPHFLFNALNSIQGLIIKNDQKSARYHLAKFAHLMRQILDNSRSGSISLEEEIKTLENYLLIEKLSRKDTFEYVISVDDSINQSTLQLPPMLVQPFVENAIIHAFTGKEDKGKIAIAIERQGDLLLVVITDNGIGRAAAGEISKQGVNRRSVGIEVTEQRLQAHNGKLEAKSIKIIDLLNKDMEAVGTQVEINIRVE